MHKLCLILLISSIGPFFELLVIIIDAVLVVIEFCLYILCCDKCGETIRGVKTDFEYVKEKYLG